jgi:hypothetical protein
MRPAGLLLAAAAGALIAVSLFFGGALGDGRLFWIGLFAEIAGLGAASAVLAGFLPLVVPGRVGAWAFGLLAAFVGWLGVTMIWSVAADRSWAYLNRGLVYLSFALLGLVVASNLARPARTAAAGLAVLLFGVVGWALLGKVFPSLFPDGGRVARLRDPIGYWNALALACTFALPLALWAATRREWRRELRVAGAVLLYLATIALVLTYSRAGIILAAVAVIAWLVLLPAVRLESFGALLVAVVPAAAVAGWASTRAGLVDDSQALAARRADGGWFALVTILVGVVVVVTALWLEKRDRGFDDEAARHLWSRRIGLAAGALAVAALIGASAASGGPGTWLDEFRGGAQVSYQSSRLGTLSSDNRWTWWKEAWRVFEKAPAEGKGAATFAVARTRVRTNAIVTNEPHNVALQALAETGIVGLLLGGGAAVLALVAVAVAVRRLRAEERAAAVALAIAVAVYVLHALVDIDWDFVAVSAPAFLLGGFLIGLGAPAVRLRARPLLVGAVVICLLAGVYSLTAPWLAANRVQDAESANLAGNAGAAASAARDAAQLNPFSVDPITQLALAYASVRDIPNAIRQYRRATRLQPENADTWFSLGQYAYCIGRYHDAYVALNQAYTLDPYGPAGIRGGYLDRARAKVNAGVNLVPPSRAGCSR